MRSPLKPFALLLVVSAAVFGLALWSPFSPSTPGAPAGSTSGDRVRGATIFAASCSRCHGPDASGGVGPALRDTGLSAAEVEAVVSSGRGAMPAEIVSGQDAADVAAHVASLAQ
jgi:cytochrome c551